MHAVVTVESPIVESPRVQQVRGLFDLRRRKRRASTGALRCRIEERPWNIGLIIGPSGCGKTTIARHLWPRETLQVGRTVLAARPLRSSTPFPKRHSIKDVTALLSARRLLVAAGVAAAVHVLSTGQQFRVTLARLLAEALPAPGRRSSSWTSTPASWIAPWPRSAAPPWREPSAQRGLPLRRRDLP